ncbi:mechanosensitive ion channel family protein [Pontibacter burrus]|uniref:Mechanosensing system component YbdG n=1 Tax=Pontibacter burrus TaxID=2704466 RepID=A0A6B3LW13_9BACT|nr:mechanosensitive ion channel domain-containing protein [Pontibacter burrus]NEM98486.1 mechanosensitive ion channel [Pontibacter burrus]
MNSTPLPTLDTSWLTDQLVQLGLHAVAAVYLNMLLLLLATVLLSLLSGFIARKIMVGMLQKFASRTTTSFDDYLLQNKVVLHLSRIFPLTIVVLAIPVIFADFSGWIAPLLKLTDVYVVLLGIWIIRSVLRTSRDYLKTFDSLKDKPIDSFTQVLTIFTFFIGGLMIFSLLTGKPLWTFITAMGAASAILLLVFKDTILGFVASIQVSTNDMVRIGDWITMEKYGADGDVVEINLTTVKVQNWDKTITTIPTYYLISDSFKNWRGMQRTGGRRIKRSIHLKISSIKYLSPEDVARLSKIHLLKDYLQERQQQIDRHNKEKGIDKTLLINGRNLTNAGVFRAYASAYIAQNENVHKELTMMVRQLEPTTTGMPIELYLFSNDVRWVYYENIMADIFDHLLAAVRYFDLEVFEMPASDDMRRLSEAQNLVTRAIPPLETLQN